MRSPRRQRVLNVIARSIFGLAIVSISTYIVWYEFGWDIFKSPIFAMLIFLWATYGVMMFFDRMEKAMEKTTTEKFDELIEEIRGMRKDLINSQGGNKDGGNS